MTTFWKVSLWLPPVAALLFFWFALGRYTPLVQNRVSCAETARDVSSLQLIAAEAGVREALANRGKSEDMVDSVKTLRQVFDTRQADLERRKQAGAFDGTQFDSLQIREATDEFVRLRQYFIRKL